MRKYIPLFLFILLISTHELIWAQTNDAQLWIGYEMDKKVIKRTKTHLKYQVRFTDNYTRFDYAFFDFGIDYSLHDNISISTAYVINMKNDRELSWLLRNQWYGNIQFEQKLGKFKISNREQVQTDLEDDIEAGGNWFYRNKTALQYKLNKKLTPYIQFEGYMRIGERPPSEDVLYRTRYHAGVKYRYNKRNDLTLSFLYQRQIRRNQPDHIYSIILNWSHATK